MRFAPAGFALLLSALATGVAGAQPDARSTGVVESVDGAGLRAVLPLSKLDPDSPVTIEAEALEVSESPDGARTLTFRRNVRVEQADLRLRAASLEASYPAGAKQPDRLTARGAVRVSQGGRAARCDRADYTRRAQMIYCRGNASIQDGDDRIEGDVIVFDLANARVHVEGGTDVALQPAEAKGGRGLGDLGSKGPLRIQAQGLEAVETETGRKLSFRGSVEVLQEELSLAADRIDAVYPRGANQPDTIVAEGHVRMRQEDRSAECVRAEYDRPGQTLDCFGPARLAQRGDSVTGDHIEFDLASERLRVTGSTRLVLAPRATSEGGER